MAMNNSGTYGFVRTSNHIHFASIAARSSREIALLKKKVSVVRADSKPLDSPFHAFSDRQEEVHALESEIFVAACHSVIYSAMTAETYIYDYAARRLGDSYTQSYLDKMDVVSKWVVVPNLVLGLESAIDEDALRKLRGIVKTRNQLVHHRSANLASITQGEFEKLEKRLHSMVDLAEKAPSSVLHLLQCLGALDPNEVLLGHFKNVMSGQVVA